VTLTNETTGVAEDFLLDEEGSLTPAGRGKKPTRFSSPYATLFADGMSLLARDRRVRGTDHRVLHALLLLAPIAEREFPTQISRIAGFALMGEREAALSIARLAEVGLIERPRHGWLAFNPRYVWRGGAVAREEALREKIASGSAAEDLIITRIEEDA
jgi:hypothetical protein